MSFPFKLYFTRILGLGRVLLQPDQQTNFRDQGICAFFERNGLTHEHRFNCDQAASGIYPSSVIRTLSTQGQCSYSVMVDNHIILQFRPQSFKIDLQIAWAAIAVFGRYAPAITYLGANDFGSLAMYAMDIIPGVPYQAVRALSPRFSDEPTWSKQVNLCKDFAAFLGTSWHHEPHVVHLRNKGRVARTMRERVEKLSHELPQRFRTKGNEILRKWQYLQQVPLVLNHGDIGPTNIMVDRASHRLTGLVDWAEGEVLPFGTCFYGVEELFGYMSAQGWTYYERQELLRDVFWCTLVDQIPQLKEKSVLEAVLLARDIGVLLWHGYAWDEGAIDRVVDEDIDVTEVGYLTAFLGVGVGVHEVEV